MLCKNSSRNWPVYSLRQREFYISLTVFARNKKIKYFGDKKHLLTVSNRFLIKFKQMFLNLFGNKYQIKTNFVVSHKCELREREKALDVSDQIAYITQLKFSRYFQQNQLLYIITFIHLLLILVEKQALFGNTRV